MRLKYSFETMELDNEIIAIPVGEGAKEFHGVIKLNETAAFILDLLKDDISEEDIVLALEKEYKVARDKLIVDVKKYLYVFETKGMLI